jgi:excisionase family DNA binding protein
MQDCSTGTTQKLAYTKKEASSLISVSVRTIDNLIATKELTARHVGRRVIIPHSSLMALLKCNSYTMPKAA